MLFSKATKREEVVMLPISSIQPNPAQPRTVFDEVELNKLAESIKQNGILQPITVRVLSESGYELISGERRLKACRMLGLDKVKAILIEANDKQSAIFAMIENLQREDLNFFDEARGIYELIYQWNVTQDEAAVKLGMAQSTVANKLRLLRLPTEIQGTVTAHGLTERHARALLRLKIPEQQKQAVAAIAQKKMNVAQAEQYIEGILEGKPPEPKRLLIVKDLRIFLKTIDRAVDVMKQAGIEARATQNEEADYIEYHIKIPKTSAYQENHTKGTTLYKVSI